MKSTAFDSKAVKERVDSLLVEYIGGDTFKQYREKVEKYFWKVFQSIFAEDFGPKSFRRLYRIGRVFVNLALPEELFFRIFKEVKELVRNSPEAALERRISMGFMALMRAYLDVDDMPSSDIDTINGEVLSLLLKLRKQCKETRKDLVYFMLKDNMEELNKKLVVAQEMISKLKLHITNKKKLSRLDGAFNLYLVKVKNLINQREYDLDSLYIQIKEIDRVSRHFTELIDNILLELLYSTAFIDILTGLYTRNYLEHALRTEIHRAKRLHMPLSLMLVDIDNFKRINDRYGHDAGDTVLMEVGKFIRSVLRNCDIPIRLGGEEFLVLLPHTNLDGAVVVAERLRKVAEGMRVRHENSLISLTVSVGVSEVKDLEDPYKYIKLADKALYMAKKQGKNRVVFLNEG